MAESQPQPAKVSYLEKRHKIYSISEEICLTSLNCSTAPRDSDGLFELRKASWFFADERDNIKILFKTLDNRPLMLHSGENKWVKQIYRTCLSPANRQAAEEAGHPQRYHQPPGTHNIIFHSQGIIDSYLAGQKVNTLYLVEGEYKAFVAWMHSLNWQPTKKQREDEPNLPPASGLPIMGLTGIWGFRDPDQSLHSDILEYIRVCSPENIVFVYDADLKNLPKGYDPSEDSSKDLGSRLKSFHDSIVAFRDVAKGRVKDIYITWISPEIQDSTIPGTESAVKGLDDLFASELRDPKLLLFDLCKSIRPKTQSGFFKSINVTAQGPVAIRKEFLLNYSKGGPQAFYAAHDEVLETHEFVFQRNKFRYSADSGFVEMTAHGDSKEYIRVSSKYFKIIRFPDARGNTLRDMIPWAKGEIAEDYLKQHKNFFSTIPKYNRFINIPENDPDRYEQEKDECYNLYYPIDHEIRGGKWPLIEKYLKHVFDEQYALILDWIYITYTNPVRNLPAICLVSKEKGTGKTKFIELMVSLFQNNAVLIGNAEITDLYNDDYVTKLIIGIDEGLIDKKVVLEKMKSWITGRHAQMSTKFLSRSRVDMIAKIIMTSNNVNDFIRIDDDENRFWVRYVNPFEGEEIPDLIDQMTLELPCFIHYLRNEHKMTYEDKTRLFFHPETYETETLHNLRRESRSQTYKDIDIIIQERFSEYNSNTITQETRFTRLYYTISQISEMVYGRTNGDRQWVKKTLNGEFKLEVSKTNISAQMPERQVDGINGEMYVLGLAKPGKFITFRIEDFMDSEEMSSLGVDPEKVGHEYKQIDATIPF